MSATVTPDKIEKKLSDIWDELKMTGQMRACLFNLVLFNPLSKRTEYIKKMSQKVLEKFPCRIILVNHDPDRKELETKVSVIPQDDTEGSVVCDFIEITTGTKDLEKSSFLLLPHLLPDLPIYILWADELDLNNPIYQRIKDQNIRTVFDSECTKDLCSFAKSILYIGCDVADLNWDRLESWRNLFVLNFQPKLYLNDLKKAENIKIEYNCCKTDFFSNTRIQALYFQLWLADRFNWEFVSGSKEKMTFKKEDGSSIDFCLRSSEIKDHKPATIISIQIESGEKTFEFVRSEDNFDQVIFKVTTKTTCDIPTNFFIEKSHEGQSLVKEIYYKGTSKHFISMLNKLIKLPKDCVC